MLLFATVYVIFDDDACILGDIGSAQCLKALHLSNNKLSSLPEGICQLRTLQSLWLDHNNITGNKHSLCK